MPRARILSFSVLLCLLIGLAGCGGNLPEAGARAELPPDYKEKEKKIADGFKAMMKEQAAAKKKSR